MEKHDWPLRTYAQLLNGANSTCEELSHYLLNPVKPFKRRFLALAFVNEEKKTGYRSIHDSFSMPYDVSQIDPNTDYLRRRVLAGFSVLEWDCNRGILQWNSQVLRTMNRRSTLDQDLLNLLVSKVLEECKSHQNILKSSPITYIWTMIRTEHSRFLFYATKMGFIKKSCSNDFNSLKEIVHISPQQQDLFVEMVVKVEDFLDLVKSKMPKEELEALDSLPLSQYLRWKRHAN